MIYKIEPTINGEYVLFAHPYNGTEEDDRPICTLNEPTEEETRNLALFMSNAAELDLLQSGIEWIIRRYTSIDDSPPDDEWLIQFCRTLIPSRKDTP